MTVRKIGVPVVVTRSVVCGTSVKTGRSPAGISNQKLVDIIILNKS